VLPLFLCVFYRFGTFFTCGQIKKSAFGSAQKCAEFVKKFFIVSAKYLHFFQINWYIMEINLYLEAYIR